MSFVVKLREAVLKSFQISLDVADSISDAQKLTISSADNTEDTFELTSNSGFKKEDGSEFDIRTVYFCWMNKDESSTDYLEKCNNLNISIIPFTQRTNLVSFLSGDMRTSEFVLAGVQENEAVDGKSAEASNKINQSVEEKAQSTQAKESLSSNAVVSVSSSNKRKATEDVEKIDYKESKRQKIENDPLLKEISLHEIELIDHNKGLRGANMKKSNDFKNLIRECEVKILKPLKQKSGSAGSGPSSSNKAPSSSSSLSSAARPSKSSSRAKVSSSSSSKISASGSADASNSLATILKKKDPIIILSPSAISMLNMSNIKAFLQEGKFVDSADTSNQNSVIQVVRNSRRFNKKIKFVVVNNVEKFFIKPEYWDRVVAVFTTGQEWQFKNYKINQPNLLFQKVKGFYVNYSGDLIPENVKNWNVQLISLDRNQRFKDRQISEFLWESIERFMFSKGYK